MAQKKAALYPVHGTSALKPISQNTTCDQHISPAPILDFNDYAQVKHVASVATLERKKVRNFVENRSAKRPSINGSSSLSAEEKKQKDRKAFGLCFSTTFISMVSLIVLGV